MIDVSSKFIEASLSKTPRVLGSLLVIDGSSVYAFTSTHLQSMTIYRNAVDSDTYTIGSVNSNKVEAVVLSSDVDGSPMPNKSLAGLAVIPMLGFQIYNETTDAYENHWIQLGKYYVDDTETRVEGLFTKVVAYDVLNDDVVNRYVNLSKTSSGSNIYFTYTDPVTNDSNNFSVTGLYGTPKDNLDNLEDILQTVMGNDRFTIDDGYEFVEDTEDGFVNLPYNNSQVAQATYRNILSHIATSCGANVITSGGSVEIIDPSLSPIPTNISYTAIYSISTGVLTISELSGSSRNTKLYLQPGYSVVENERMYLYKSMGVLASSGAGEITFTKPTFEPLIIGDTYSVTYNSTYKRLTFSNEMNPSKSGDTVYITTELHPLIGKRLLLIKKQNALTPNTYVNGSLSFDANTNTVLASVQADIGEQDTQTMTYTHSETSTATLSFDNTFFTNVSQFDVVAPRIFEFGDLEYRGFNVDLYSICFLEPLDTLIIQDVPKPGKSEGEFYLLTPFSVEYKYTGGLTVSLKNSSMTGITNVPSS